MPVGDYLLGVGLLVAMLALTCATASILLRRRFPWLEGVDRVVAFGLIATLAILAVHLVPAGLGVLGRGSVLIASFAAFGLAALVRPALATVPDEPAIAGVDADRGRSMPLALICLAGVVIFVLAFARDQSVIPSTSIDYSNFHMPDVALWIQNGSIWQIASLLPSVAPGNYPNNGDVMLLAFVLPWHSDFAAHAPMYAFFLLTGVAAYALALRIGAARSAAIVAGALVSAIPVVAISALSLAITDSVMLFGFTAGILFLVRHSRNGRTAELVLAGLALGLSFGTKWYGVSAVAVVVAVWGVATFLARRDAVQVLRQGLVLSGLITLAGGIWLLRNWIESGNPVFPVRVAPFGLEIFDAPPDLVREQAGFTIADYIGQSDPWIDWILPAFRQALAAPSALILLGGITAVGLILLRRSVAAGRGVLFALAAAAGLITLAYSVTPYTAAGPEGFPVLTGGNSRYVVPALLIGAALAAWVATQLRHGTVAFAGLGVLAVAHGVRQAASGELAPARLTWLDWLGGIALALAAVVAIGLVHRHRSTLVREGRPTAPGALGLAIAAALVVFAGYEVQQRFNDDRYLGADPALDAVIDAESEETRVGLSGVWSDQGISPVLPAFGTRFENEVEFVGPIERELRQRYDSREPFVDALREGQYDLLIVGRGREPLPPPQEGRWAEAAGWEMVVEGERFQLLTPPAD